jgi:Fe-S-cluster containining protein
MPNFMESEKIIEELNKKLIEYCLSKCDAHCCRSGFLSLKGYKELDVVAGKNKRVLEKKGLLKEDKGVYILDITKNPCPQLDNKNRCRVYSTRPFVCREFPLLINNKFIVAAPGCPAIKDKILESYFNKLEKEGYKLI